MSIKKINLLSINRETLGTVNTLLLFVVLWWIVAHCPAVDCQPKKSQPKKRQYSSKTLSSSFCVCRVFLRFVFLCGCAPALRLKMSQNSGPNGGKKTSFFFFFFAITLSIPRSQKKVKQKD